MEGQSVPVFGFAYSIDKHLYNIDMDVQSNLDNGQPVLHEAQRISNFFVDQTRLNGNSFSSSFDES